MKNKNLKTVIFLIVAATAIILLWRTNPNGKITAESSQATTATKKKRFTASSPGTVKPKTSEKTKTPAVARDDPSTTATHSLDQEIAALPKVEKIRFIRPAISASFIKLSSQTREISNSLSKAAPEEPPFDIQKVAKYSHAVARFFRESGMDSNLENYPYLSSTETGELLKLYCGLESIP